jgi:hypothetical protein
MVHEVPQEDGNKTQKYSLDVQIAHETGSGPCYTGYRAFLFLSLVRQCKQKYVNKPTLSHTLSIFRWKRSHGSQIK